MERKRELLTFAEMLGHRFRHGIAKAIDLDSAQHVKAEHHPLIAEPIRQRQWTGEGKFDDLLRRIPFEVSVWMLTLDHERIKIRGSADVAQLYAKLWSLGSIVDIWLKTPMLTFTRTFPHEIDRFEPVLVNADLLAHHRTFCNVFDLLPEFDEAFLASKAGDQPTRLALLAEVKAG